MSKLFNIPIEIKCRGVLSVTAENQDEAFDLADKTMFWAYQNGDPTAHKDVSITDCEIEVEGEELDLDNDRWGSDEQPHR